MWMKKYSRFLEGIPEEVRASWLTSLSPHIAHQYEEGIVYTAIFNPWREQRQKLREEGRIKIPSLSESIAAYQKGLKNTVLLGDSYLPYYILINIFALMADHITIAFNTPNNYYGSRREIQKNDLETMLQIQEDLGLMIWHNMKGAGATILYWEHFQGISFKPSVRGAQKECHDSKAQRFFMPTYPGSHIILRGKQGIHETLETLNFLDRHELQYTLGIDDGFIYVTPVKNDVAGAALGLSEKSRIGGFETFGSYVALTEADFDKVQSGKVKVRDVLQQGLYSWKELNLFER